MKKFIIIALIVFALFAVVTLGAKKPTVEYMLKKYPELFDIKKVPNTKTKTWSEGENPPEAAIGLQIMENIRLQQEAHHLNQTHVSLPNLSVEQIEGTQVPGYNPNNFVLSIPMNTKIAIGTASNVYKNSGYLFGGTTDTLGYEKLIAGSTFQDTTDRVYSFDFERCGWGIEHNLGHGNKLAFSTAVHYSHPACPAVSSTPNPALSPAMDTGFQQFCGKDVIVVFGGTNGTNTRNTVLFYEPEATGDRTTTIQKPSSVFFDARELNLAGHTAVVWSHYMIVVGGLQFDYGKNVRPNFSNKVWVFDFETQQWSQASFVGTNGQQLPPLAFHTTEVYCSTRFGGNCLNNADAEAELWIYGGLLEDGTINEDLYVLRLDPDGNHTAIIDTKCDPPMITNYTLPTYRLFKVVTECPRNGTFGHGVSVHGTSMFVFGGALYSDGLTKFPIPLAGQQTVVDPTYHVSDEFWRYDFVTNEWFNLTEINPWMKAKFGLVMLEFDDKLHFIAGLNDEYHVSTGVHSINVETGRYEFVPCCSPGWSGKKCKTPICSCGCGGENVGRCVAPDTCECENGFTGKFCTEHACDNKYGYNLVSLNSVVFYPEAVANLRRKLTETLDKLTYIQRNFPQWDSSLVFVKKDLENLAKALYSFNEQNVDGFMTKVNELLALMTNL